jgi:hypothetical protein
VDLIPSYGIWEILIRRCFTWVFASKNLDDRRCLAKRRDLRILKKRKKRRREKSGKFEIRNRKELLGSWKIPI